MTRLAAKRLMQRQQQFAGGAVGAVNHGIVS